MGSDRLNTKSWSMLAVSFAEQLGRRWADVYGPPLRDSVSLLANSRHARELAGESAARLHLFARDLQVAPSIALGLNFTFDSVAESVGPRYAPLPAGWPAAPSHWPTYDLIGEPRLTPENVVVRMEGGRLSATLINLQELRSHFPKGIRHTYTLRFAKLMDTAQLHATHLGR